MRTKQYIDSLQDPKFLRWLERDKTFWGHKYNLITDFFKDIWERIAEWYDDVVFTHGNLLKAFFWVLEQAMYGLFIVLKWVFIVALCLTGVGLLIVLTCWPRTPD